MRHTTSSCMTTANNLPSWLIRTQPTGGLTPLRPMACHDAKWLRSSNAHHQEKLNLTRRPAPRPLVTKLFFDKSFEILSFTKVTINRRIPDISNLIKAGQRRHHQFPYTRARNITIGMTFQFRTMPLISIATTSSSTSRFRRAILKDLSSFSLCQK